MTRKLDLNIGEREMLHNRVCSILRKSILKGDFKPGERLVQTELAELIGVSRLPIREALRTIELEGLVTIEPHKGAVVREISKDDIQEIYDIRALLEPEAVRKAMDHYTEKDFEQLKKLHEAMLETESGEEFADLNKQFHNILVSRCNSPRLLRFISMVSHGFPQDTPQIIPGQVLKSNEEHELILKGVLERDVERATHYLEKHIKRSGMQLIHSMEEREFQT